MDSLEQVKKLREEYERALDAAESRRVAYHEAVLALYRDGMPLREIAKELGLSHQRVHQIVSSEAPPPGRRNLGRAASGIGGALLLVAATFGALRLAHATPFAQTPAIAVVTYHTEGPAARVSRPARPEQGRARAVALFKANPQGSGPKVIPGSVRHVASVHIPAVGPVAFWYGRARRGGWCAGLRVSGDWIGYTRSRRLGRRLGLAGVVPGCFAIREQMRATAKRRPVSTGFECEGDVIDYRGAGELWQIRFGLVLAPGAVEVRDRLSGRSTAVIDGRFFALAIRHPRRHTVTMRLAAYDGHGHGVAKSRSAFGC